MRIKTVWGIVLLSFTAFTLYTLVTNDIAGMVDYMKNPGPWGFAAIIDLLLALMIGIFWMWRDAKARGIAPLPYAILTLAMGSIGLLAYLFIHGAIAREHARPGGIGKGVD